MGQAVQTINAADKGISAITSMIEQAKGIAQSALSADNTGGVGFDTVTITIGTQFAAGETIAIGGVDFTATDGDVVNNFEIATSSTDMATTAANLADAINTVADDGWGDNEFKAVADGATITLSKYTDNDAAGVEVVDQDDAATTDVVEGNAKVSTALVEADPSELWTLEYQYNTLLNQLTELAEDSGYKGKNLLSATPASRSMIVQFEGTTLTVDGFDATANTGLGVTNATWTASGSIDGDLTKLDTALAKLHSESARLSSNLSIITVRQDFT